MSENAYSIPVFSAEGLSAGTVELEAGLFPSKRLATGAVHQVIVGLETNSRKPVAHTKDRSDVSGGGKKPWRQKGTGRARQGSIRSPQWKGGGVVFGPRSERNTSQKINKSLKRRVFLEVLKGKLAASRVMVIESPRLERPSTKAAAKVLAAVRGDSGRDLLFVCHSAGEPVLRKSVANISSVKTIDSGELGVLEMMKASLLVFTRPAFEQLEERLKNYGHFRTV